MAQLRLLGAIELRNAEGHAISAILAQPKRLALLSYLACAAPAFVRRDTLFALLWPELDETRARSALNQAVGFLRRHLSSGDAAAILSRGDEDLAVDPRVFECDVVTFREAIRDGRHDRAVETYRGDFMPGFFIRGADGFEEWLEVERARLRAQASKAAEEAARGAERAGTPSTAIAYARRAIDFAPADDRAMRQLLQLFDRVGERAAAVEAYDAFATRLREQFGAEPAEETTLLIHRIRSRTTGSAAQDEEPRQTGDVEPLAPADSIPTRRTWRRTTLAAALLLSAAVPLIWYRGTRYSRSPTDSLTVGVFPFRVSGPDSSYNFLSEGAMNVFNGLLARPGTSQALDARTMLSEYQTALQNGRALSSFDAAALAGRLGAGYAVTGELVATQSGTTVNARLVETSSGKVVAQHSASGAGDPLKLASKAATGLFAKSVGESPTRLSAMSDSADAVQAYLDGMRDTRAGRVKPAFDRFTRALEIDPTFAAAALWRAHVAWGAVIFGNTPKLIADSVAWSLRDRLSARDRLFLETMPSIGPNYPRPTSATQFARAWERAAHANPDRPEIWTEWSRFLIAWGHQAGGRGHLAVAARAADSAIALDSLFTRALVDRVYIALLTNDTIGARRAMRLWERADTATNPSLRWAAARMLGDSLSARALFSRISSDPASSGGRLNLELWSAHYGLASVADADRVAEHTARAPATPASARDAAIAQRARVAVLRGAYTQAGALADSINRRGLHFIFVRLAAIDSAFTSVAAPSVSVFESRLDTITDRAGRANTLCDLHLDRLSKGDTTRARQAIKEMRELVRPLGAAPAWRVGDFDVCPLVLEAWLDRRPSRRWESAALDRLERVLLDGTLGEAPGNFANVLAARWRREQGKLAQALTLIRRRDPMSGVLAQPAGWRLEGELAAATGDRAGAVRAYRRYLEIRDQPDPGPVAMEVSEVRRALDALQRR